MSLFAEKIIVLRDRLTDSREGYERAAADARDARYARLFERAERLHEDALAAIRPFLPLEADERGGTAIGAMTKAIVFVRGVIGGDDGLLPGMIDGAERVLDACDEARVGAVTDAAALEALARVEASIGGLLAELRTARAAA